MTRNWSSLCMIAGLVPSAFINGHTYDHMMTDDLTCSMCVVHIMSR